MNDLLRLIQLAKDRSDADRFAVICVVSNMAVGVVMGVLISKIL